MVDHIPMTMTPEDKLDPGSKEVLDRLDGETKVTYTYTILKNGKKSSIIKFKRGG